MRLRRKKKTKAVPEETVEDPPKTVNANGDMRTENETSALTLPSESPAPVLATQTPPTTPSTPKTPPPERKSKFSALGRIFKPWKWKRRKKPSEKIEKQAVDLERKISVRTTREELIKRGVLKEVHEDPAPSAGGDDDVDGATEATSFPVSNTKNNEKEKEGKSNIFYRIYKAIFEEAVQEDKSDSSSSSGQVHANGTTSTPHSVHLNDDNGGFMHTHPPHQETIMIRENNNGTIMTEAEMAHNPNSSPFVSANQVKVSIMEDGRGHDSPRMEQPNPIRVMLPVGENEKRALKIQNSIQTPAEYESTAPGPDVSTPPAHSMAQNHQLHHHHHHHMSGVTSSGLSYTTPTGSIRHPQHTPNMKGSPFILPPIATHTPGITIHQSFIHEVPASEPDLSKKPLRSAMKGSRSRAVQQYHPSFSPDTSFSETNTLPRDCKLKDNRPKVAPKPKMKMGSVRMDSSNKENQPNGEDPDYDNLHSDSDEEIHYRDDDDNNTDTLRRRSILAARVQRSDSLERFLSRRPGRRELVERNILPSKSEYEIKQDKQLIGNRLTRRLSLRPTQEELEEKNILHRQTAEEMRREKEEKKRTLIRKLSFRPTVEELKEKKIISFNDYVEKTDTYDYDRRADKPWTRLTPRDKAAIRKELNEFKSTEMTVHEDSRHLTRFHRP